MNIFLALLIAPDRDILLFVVMIIRDFTFNLVTFLYQKSKTKRMGNAFLTNRARNHKMILIEE